MKQLLRKLALLGLSAALLLSLAACGKKSETLLDPASPVTVTIWNYYNGDQLAAFEALVEKFNATVGAEKGIVAVSVSQGDVGTLADTLLDAVSGKAGAENVPSLAAVYTETGYILDQEDALVALDGYFTEEELSAYVPGFLDEGRFNAVNELLLFPICKSTEVFAANATDWAAFENATGLALADVQTKEDLTAAAKVYYEWTDSLTPDEREDGLALYGRDAMANYLYIGSYQLGHELFAVQDGALTLDLDRDTFKTLWDNYYIPYINGYFGSYANFRSEDAKTGKILSLTSSSTGVSYLPTAVVNEDDSSHDIEMTISGDLPFADASVPAAVQQGASFCLLKTDDAQQEGAVAFLRWFTEPAQNVAFSLSSGYSPVNLAANTKDSITAAYTGDASTPRGKMTLDSLLVCADVFANKVPYASKPFQGSKNVRSYMETVLQSTAETDRAAVTAAIAGGATRVEAVAPYVTDAYFDAWFTALCTETETLTTR